MTIWRLIAHSSVWIHLLNLLDGSPYRGPLSNIIVWEFPRGVGDVSISRLGITSSRIMMLAYCSEVVQQEDFGAWRLFVWDWKTGDLVRSLRFE